MRLEIAVWALLMVLPFSAATRRQPRQDGLKLETVLVKQQYCNSGDVHVLLFELKLKFTNTGNVTLILYKGSNLVSYVRVARNQQELEQKRYEISQSTTWVSSGPEGLPDVGQAPDARFAVLKAGQSFTMPAEARIPSLNLLATGEHVLQVIVPTWKGTPAQAEGLKRRWEWVGELWIGNAFSTAMPFVFGPEKAKKC